MAKSKFLANLTIGEAVEKECFLLKQYKGEFDSSTIEVIFGDNSGEMIGHINKDLVQKLGMPKLDGVVFSVSGIVLPEARTPVLKVKEIVAAKDYVPAEVNDGLSAEKVQFYIADIKTLMELISNANYKALVAACLTDENLQKLSRLPATLNYYGRYPGGALAATDSVARMALSSMTSYYKRGNGMTTQAPSWSGLITASLLFTFGRIRYYTPEPPYKKTADGIALGYFSCLENSIKDVMFRENIRLTEDEYSFLMNILQVSVSDKTEAKSLSKDGSALRFAIAEYSEYETYDYEVSTHVNDDSKEPLYWSPKLKRFILKCLLVK